MPTVEKNVRVQFSPDDRLFHVTIERDGEKTVMFRVDGTDVRHLFRALDKAINDRPRSEEDWKALEAQYLAEKARRDAAAAPTPPSAEALTEEDDLEDV